MGAGASRREPEVHVVVVQSKDDGRLDARVVRQQPYKGAENTNKNTTIS